MPSKLDAKVLKDKTAAWADRIKVEARNLQHAWEEAGTFAERDVAFDLNSIAQFATYISEQARGHRIS